MRFVTHGWIVLLAALGAVGSFGIAPERDTDRAPEIVSPDPARTHAALVVEVIDGDSVTLILDGQPARYEILGADTPEWVPRSPEPDPRAAEARAFLTQLLLGESVRVFEPEPGATDPVGRRRGYLFREPDGMFVDLEVVRQGYGRVSVRAGVPYLAVLRWYEQRARAFHRGIWSTPESVDATPATVAQPASVPEIAAPDPEPAKPAQEPEPADDWVWITKSGNKYHNDGCQYLTDSKQRVHRSDVADTYEPCKVCHPDD